MRVPGNGADRFCERLAALPAKNGPEKNRLSLLCVRLKSAFSVRAPRCQSPPTAVCVVRSMVSRAKLRIDSSALVQVMLFRSSVPGNSVALPGTKVGEASTLT
jgi:hypothetical protein